MVYIATALRPALYSETRTQDSNELIYLPFQVELIQNKASIRLGPPQEINFYLDTFLSTQNIFASGGVYMEAVWRE